jgi:uncharacterized protein YggU (UPF0235/DUF167 family)
LLRLLADELDIPKRDVRLIAGANSRTKLIVIERIEPDVILEKWPGLKL